MKEKRENGKIGIFFFVLGLLYLILTQFYEIKKVGILWKSGWQLEITTYLYFTTCKQKCRSYWILVGVQLNVMISNHPLLSYLPTFFISFDQQLGTFNERAYIDS